ncbi:DUF4352 domain-containing protein [Methanocaldococcus infernus]
MALGLRTMVMLSVTIIVLGIVFVSFLNITDKVLGHSGLSDQDISKGKEITELSLNQIATYGNISIKIVDLFKTKKIIGNMGRKEADKNETFLFIKVRIDNHGDLPYQISNLDFELKDENNKTYDPEMNVLDIPDALVLTAVQPHRKIEGYLIFKIPENLEKCKLVYKLNFVRKEIQWNINLTDVKELDEYSVIRKE